MNDYSFVLASYVGDRDGMAMELRNGAGDVVAEIFEDDESRRCTFSMPNGAVVPVSQVQKLLSRAALEFPGIAEGSANQFE